MGLECAGDNCKNTSIKDGQPMVFHQRLGVYAHATDECMSSVCGEDIRLHTLQYFPKTPKLLRAELAHRSRERVDDPSKLTREDKILVEATLQAFEQLVHEIVVGDVHANKIKSWSPLYDLINEARHCTECSTLTITAAVRIIANMFYKVHPEMTFDTFVETYRKEYMQ